MVSESHLSSNSVPTSAHLHLPNLKNGAIIFNSEGHSVVEVHGSVPVTQVFSARKFSPPSAFIKRVTNVANDIVKC